METESSCACTEEGWEEAVEMQAYKWFFRVEEAIDDSDEASYPWFILLAVGRTRHVRVGRRTIRALQVSGSTGEIFSPRRLCNHAELNFLMQGPVAL